MEAVKSHNTKINKRKSDDKTLLLKEEEKNSPTETKIQNFQIKINNKGAPKKETQSKKRQRKDETNFLNQIEKDFKKIKLSKTESEKIVNLTKIEEEIKKLKIEPVMSSILLGKFCFENSTLV